MLFYRIGECFEMKKDKLLKFVFQKWSDIFVGSKLTHLRKWIFNKKKFKLSFFVCKGWNKPVSLKIEQLHDWTKYLPLI